MSYIPVPPSPWVPTATHDVTKRLPDDTMAAIQADITDQVADSGSGLRAELDATFVAVFADTAIEYDGSGNVTSVTENGIETTYTYNPDGTVDTDTRLGVTRQYTYDGTGNLTGIEAI